MRPHSLVLRVLIESTTGSSRFNPLSLIVYNSKRSAGHAHWQNVRSTKEAGDKLKSQTSNYYIRAVSHAIKDGGGIRDPKLNPQLASVLAHARANSVPFSTLERVLREDAADTHFLFEVIAQGGLFILVEGFAKSVPQERHRLAHIVKRFGCSVSPASGKIASEFFDHVGLLNVSSKDNQSVSDLDSATNLAIELGARDVIEVSSDGNAFFQFHCDPHYLHSLQQKLEQEYKVVVSSAEDVYIPKDFVKVTPAAYQNLREMYSKIRAQREHVERIFDNVTVQQDTQ